MITLVRAAIVGIGISLLAGCGGGSTQQGKASFAPGRSTARAISQEPRVYESWGFDRQDTRGAKTAGEKDRSLSVSGVTIDPSLLSACGIPSADAFFEFDSAQIKDDSENTLALVAKCLSTGPLAGQSIEIIGHTDPRGTDEYNYQLGKSRAQSVADYLSSRGVPTGNANVTSYGESMSYANDELGWSYERRVEIKLAK